MGGWGIGEDDEFGLEQFAKEVEEKNLCRRRSERVLKFLKMRFEFLSRKNKETEDDREQIAARDI